MKKFIGLIAFFMVVGCWAGDDASCSVGFWFDAPRGVGQQEIEGLSLGIPVANNRSVEGVELSIFGNFTKNFYGLQLVLCGVNSTREMTGCQLGLVNLVKKTMKSVGAQLGVINHSGSRGIQLGLINNCEDNADLQLGLINVNRNGWLPVMIIFNCSRNFVED